MQGTMSRPAPPRQHKPRAPETEAEAPPAAGVEGGEEADAPARPDPTRYGDWEIGGRCIDF